jgi:hypothetical protein
MIRSYLERGLKSGGVAGLAFGLFVAFVGNPLIGYLEGLGHSAGEAGHGEAATAAGHVVSATVTNVVSVGGGVLWGLFLGAVVFGVVYYFLEPSIPGQGATKSYLLAGAGFVSVSGAPWLVLPPHPAGLGSLSPVGDRLVWYGGMIAAGALVCALAGYVYNRARASDVSRPVAAATALAPFTLLAALALLAPSMSATGEVSGSMVATYRGFVVFGQAGLWFVLASAHAWFGAREQSQVSVEPSSEDTASFAD